jgi:hypothetical protein
MVDMRRECSNKGDDHEAGLEEEVCFLCGERRDDGKMTFGCDDGSKAARAGAELHDDICTACTAKLFRGRVRRNTDQFGADHLDTLKAKLYLSNFLACELGEVKEAKRLYKEVIHGYTELLGPDHTDTQHGSFAAGAGAELQHAMSSLQQLQQLRDICRLSSGKTTTNNDPYQIARRMRSINGFANLESCASANAKNVFVAMSFLEKNELRLILDSEFNGLGIDMCEVYKLRSKFSTGGQYLLYDLVDGLDAETALDVLSRAERRGLFKYRSEAPAGAAPLPYRVAAAPSAYGAEGAPAAMRYREAVAAKPYVGQSPTPRASGPYQGKKQLRLNLQCCRHLLTLTSASYRDLAAYIHKRSAEHVLRCDYCDAPPNDGKALSRCAKCLCVSYCGIECQKAHWAEHKLKCLKKKQ